MSRYPTPEGDFRWDGPEHLPRAGQLFLDMAKTIGGQPVSNELSLVPEGKDRHGLIEGVQINPNDPLVHRLGFIALKHLASPDFSYGVPGDFMSYVTKNGIIVSQVAGSAGLAIARHPEPLRPQDFEELRSYYTVIHQRLGDDYISRLNQSRERARKIKFAFDRIEEEILGP